MSTDTHIESESTISVAAPRIGGTDMNGSRAHATSVPTVCQRPGAEYFDGLLWRLFDRREDADGAGYLLGVTGCARQSGVSTVAANLAIRAADHGLGPVLLIDANDQHPQLQRLFGAKSGAGLADVLAGQALLATAVASDSCAGPAIAVAGNCRPDQPPANRPCPDRSTRGRAAGNIFVSVS